MRWRVWLALVAALAAFSSVTFGLWMLVRVGGQAIADALQAATAIALLGVTAVYAVLTFRLQEATPRTTAYIDAARRLLPVLASHLKRFYQIGGAFPLRESADASHIRTRLDYPDLGSLADRIRQEAALLPGELGRQALETASSVAMAMETIEPVRLAIGLAEEFDAEQGVTRADWSRVRRAYEERLFETTVSHPEWDELESGQAVKDGLAAVESLAATLRRYIQTGQPVRGKTPPFTT